MLAPNSRGFFFCSKKIEVIILLKILFIGLGGFLGSVSRYLVSKTINNWFPFAFVPLGTIIVNLLGSFVLAYFMTATYIRYQLKPEYFCFIATGFLGAFTTFSTFTYEGLKLFSESNIRGLLYITVMFLGGLIAAYLGFLLARIKL